MNFSYKESKSNKKLINSGSWEGRGGDVTRISDFFFFQKIPSQIFFFLRGLG